jgi:hypothetical protein
MPTPIDAMREGFLQSGNNADLPIVDVHHRALDAPHVVQMARRIKCNAVKSA